MKSASSLLFGRSTANPNPLKQKKFGMQNKLEKNKNNQGGNPP